MTFSGRSVLSRMPLSGLVCLVALATACAGPPPPDSRAPDETAIRAADLALSAVAKDLDKFAGAFTSEGVMLPPNMPMASGQEEAGRWRLESDGRHLQL